MLPRRSSTLKGAAIDKRDQTDTQHYVGHDGKLKKLGPRQIGKIKGWKPANYEQHEEDTPLGASFLSPRRSYSAKNSASVEKRAQIDTQHYVDTDGKMKKLGPRQIGRISGWKPAQYDLPDTGKFLQKRGISLADAVNKGGVERRQKTDTQHYYTADGSKKKLGPRQIGRITGWTPAKYEVSDTGKFLERRASSHVNIHGAKSKVAPRMQTDTKRSSHTTASEKNWAQGKLGALRAGSPPNTSSPTRASSSHGRASPSRARTATA